MVNKDNKKQEYLDPDLKVSVEEINAGLTAEKVNSKIDIDGKGKTIIQRDKIVSPTGQTIQFFSGKKLKAQYSVVRNRENIVFEKGTTWESIGSRYKFGAEAIQWKESDFE